MRRDKFRLVLEHTEVGETFTAPELADRIGLTVMAVAAALRALKGWAFTIEERKKERITWRRIDTQPSKIFCRLL